MNNILIRGGIGTGKTILAQYIAYLIGNEHYTINDVLNNINHISLCEYDISGFIHSEKVEYIQIHPSMTYDDLVYGLNVDADRKVNLYYCEKRIAHICNLARKSKELFFVILDDISRSPISELMGDVLYAMEYRNEIIDLNSEKELIVPENVFFILCDNTALSCATKEYNFERKFDYVIDLKPDKNRIYEYYKNKIDDNILKKIVHCYEMIYDFMKYNIDENLKIEIDSLIIGHTLFLIKEFIDEEDLIKKIFFSIKYNIYPIILSMFKDAIITKNPQELLLRCILYLDYWNGSIIDDGAQIKKIKTNKDGVLISTNETFSAALNLFKDEYSKSSPQKIQERNLVEYLIDIIIYNGVFPASMIVNNILKNTIFFFIENRKTIYPYGAFVIRESKSKEYYYTKQNDGTTRNYYTQKDMESVFTFYKYIIGGKEYDYNFATQVRDVDSSPELQETFNVRLGNTVSFKLLINKLLMTYLHEYYCYAFIKYGKNSDLCKLIGIDIKYLRAVHESVPYKNNSKEYGKLITQIVSIFSQKDIGIQLDRNIFDELSLADTIDVEQYVNMLNSESKNTIVVKLEGVEMVDNNNDYQDIMDSIGIHQMIFQGPPGTSKTFETKKFVLGQLIKRDDDLGDVQLDDLSNFEISQMLEKYRLKSDDYNDFENSPKQKTGGWDIVQFHPSYGYEDFIRGIEVTTDDNNDIKYSTQNRILGKISEFSRIAKMENDSNPPKFYLIIDEINRANLATVFGELIYGLEYRNDSVSTPYEVNERIVSSDKTLKKIKTKDIVVSDNLYIVGTMNTADKSIDSLDYAIRRRFLFIDSPPDRDIVKKCYLKNSNSKDENESVELFLFDSVGRLFDGSFFNNEYIKTDVIIGHTYFLRKSNDDYLEDISDRFIYQVFPILREYLKDGILDCYADIDNVSCDIDKIMQSKDWKEKTNKISDIIMYSLIYYGEKKGDNTINDRFIRDMIAKIDEKLYEK